MHDAISMVVRFPPPPPTKSAQPAPLLLDPFASDPGVCHRKNRNCHPPPPSDPGSQNPGARICGWIDEPTMLGEPHGSEHRGSRTGRETDGPRWQNESIHEPHDAKRPSYDGNLDIELNGKDLDFDIEAGILEYLQLRLATRRLAKVVPSKR